MAITDTVGEYLTCVRNAIGAKKANVTVPASKLKIHLSELLKSQGYIKDFSVVERGVHKYIHIELRYLRGDKPAILDLQRVSKPGLRVFTEAGKIPRVRNGMGMMVVSTSKGLMSDQDARKNNIGGELICKVW